MSNLSEKVAITTKTKSNPDSAMKLDYLSVMDYDDSKWAKIMSNPTAEIMNLRSLKKSLELTTPETVSSKLNQGGQQTTTVTIIIIALDDVHRGNDHYEDLFIITCRNFIYLGGEIALVGALSLVMHTYPKILLTIRTLSPKLGIHLVIGSLYESLQAKQEAVLGNYEAGNLKFIDPQGFKLSVEERYAITNFFIMTLTKRIGDQGRSWVEHRIKAYKPKKSNLLLEELYTVSNESWNEVHDQMNSLHNFRAVILDKFLEIAPGMTPANTTLQTTRVLMRWSGCAHLSSIDQAMTTATKNFTTGAEKWYKSEMALCRWYKSELGSVFPYCRLLLTIEASDAIGRKVVAEFASFCNNFSPDKSTLQNVTKPTTDQETEIVARATLKYNSLMESMNETSV